jgi:hypothetical protein
VPDFGRGLKLEVVRPGGRVVRTVWLTAPQQGETATVELPQALYADHPGTWRARFVVRRSVRSAVAFTVRRP